MESRRMCVIRVGALEVGVDVGKMREVLRSTAVTRVPGAPDGVAGLVNLRGEIVPAVDLRRRLRRASGAASIVSTDSAVHVVVMTDAGPISLVADAVGDVVTAEQSTFEPTPSTLDASLRPLLLGAYKFERSLLLALDVDAAAELDPTADEQKPARATASHRMNRRGTSE